MSRVRIQQGVRRLEVDSERAGQRIDNFLAAHLKGVPKSHIYRLLRRGEVRVNSARIRPSYRLKAGDEVRLPPLRLAAPPSPKAPPRWLEGRILHEDPVLLVIDKPPGMAVHGGSGLGFGIIEALRALRPKEALELVHRLDRETSGCLAIAKRRSALRALHAQLREGAVEKRYLALVKGRMEGREVDLPLARGERGVRVAASGKAARTRFRPLERYSGATLVEVTLVTGRTHQIRVHAAHLGHPLAGDERYGDPDFNRAMKGKGLKRLFLHASALAFTHPRTKEAVAFSAPLPWDLRRVLDEI